MDNPPKIDPRLLEAMEACRPGSEDLSEAELSAWAGAVAADPELRTVYEKLKQTDVVLAEAFHDVPVPEGLADRIVDRLASARQAQVEDNAAESSLPIAKRNRRLWRRWVVGAALATAGSIAAFLLLGTPNERLTGEGVEWVAIMLFDDEGNPPPEGNPTSEKAPPGSYPLGDDVAPLPGIRWRRIDGGFLGRRGVAYDLAPPGSPRATVYVVKCRVPGLRGSPPYNPARNSRNRCAAAWQSGGLLYVLVVDGGVGRYREVLGMSSRPWT